MKVIEIDLEDTDGLVRVNTSDGCAYVLQIKSRDVTISSSCDSNKWLDQYVQPYVGHKNVKVYGKGRFLLVDKPK